jgi:hypothetical protein
MNKKVEKYIEEFINKVFEKFVKKQMDKFIHEDFNLNKYKYFEDLNEIETWGSEYSLYYQNLIALSNKLQASKEQLDELNDIDYYCGFYSERINNHLREITQDESLNGIIQRIDSYLNKFILRENIIVVRRVPNRFIDKKYKKNNCFIEKGFLSTSLNLFFRLDNNSDFNPLKNETLLIIKIPKSVRGAYIEKALPENKQRKEYEFLISRNQLIKVQYNKKILSNRLIKLQII